MNVNHQSPAAGPEEVASSFPVLDLLLGLLAIVLAVVLLLFGHRLPGMARSLGSGITEFKRGLKDGAKSKGGASDGTGDGSSDGDAKDSSIGSSKDDSDSSSSGSAR